MGTGIGTRIRNTRKNLGITQKELADAVGDGCEHSSISGYEKGRSVPYERRLKNLAKALKVSSSWLLTGKEDEDTDEEEVTDTPESAPDTSPPEETEEESPHTTSSPIPQSASSLRMWAIETAVTARAGNNIEDIIQAANAFVSYVSSGELTPESVGFLPAPKVTDNTSPIYVRKPTTYHLTKRESDILRVTIDEYKKGKKMSATTVAEAMNSPVPTVTQYIRKLTRKRYIQREGQRIWPLLKPDGTPLNPVVQILPARAASGYKLGDVAAYKNGGGDA